MLYVDITNTASSLQVKKEQGWQVVGTVGIEEESSDVPTVKCSDFRMLKPTLLLMGELSLHQHLKSTLWCHNNHDHFCIKTCNTVLSDFRWAV